MLEYTDIPKSECDKISVAVILLNSANDEENYDGTRHNLALVYHRFIGKYVLLIKQHTLFETDKFLVLKKTKEDSMDYLDKPKTIKYVIKRLNLKPVINTRKNRKRRKKYGGKTRKNIV